MSKNAGAATVAGHDVRLIATDAGVLVQDALFATLDPTTRRWETEDGREVTLTDTVGLAALIGKGEVSPVEVVDDVLTRIDLHNPAVNAFCHVDGEGARAAARASDRVRLSPARPNAASIASAAAIASATPDRRNRSTISVGYRPVRSHSLATGMISLSTSWRRAARKSASPIRCKPFPARATNANLPRLPA